VGLLFQAFLIALVSRIGAYCSPYLHAWPTGFGVSPQTVNNSPPRIAEFLPAVCARSLFLADWSRATAPFVTGEWPRGYSPTRGGWALQFDGCQSRSRCGSSLARASAVQVVTRRARPT